MTVRAAARGVSVRACLHCGSARLRTPSVREAAMGWNPQMDLWMCQDCRTVGRPLLFDDEDARLAYAAAKRQAGP